MTVAKQLGKRSRRRRKRFLCGPADLRPGERRLMEVDGKRVAIFNVKGDYYALHNRCPHKGGNLCEGPVTGTTLPTEQYEFVYSREGEILRCAWHGWEFEIATGVCLVNPKFRARSYEVAVENGNLILTI